MHRLESWLALITSALVLAACARSSLEMAPDRPDRPWIPATTASGEIIAGEPAPEQAQSLGYVLPSNQALARIPATPSGILSDHAYSLAELIDIAQSSNPKTRGAWDEARDAALAAGIARSAYLPNVSAGVIGAYQTGRNSSSFQGESTKNDLSVDGGIAALSLQWLLFDFGKRSALLDAARQGSVITNIAFTQAHQQVIYKVSLAFYANAAAQARMATATKALKNAQDVQTAAEGRYHHGIGTVVEVAEARQSTAQANLAQVQAEGAAQDSYLSVLAAMGISPFSKIKIADISNRKLSPAMTASIEQVVSEALARRPDTLTAYAAHEASLANLRAARAEFLPKVFVAATGSYTMGNLSLSGLPSIEQQPATLNLSQHNLGATVLMGITVPVYDAGVRDAMWEQAKANVDKSNAALEETRNEAMRDVVAAGNAAKTSLSAYDAAHALMSAAQTTFDAALQSYRHDVGTITAVTTAETQLLLAENAATDAYSNALSSAATLALSAGTLGAAPE